MMPATKPSTPPKPAKPLDELRAMHSTMGIGEIRLRDLVRQQLLIFSPDATLRNAMFELNRVGAHAGVVAEQGDMPLGIVTLHDLIDAITFSGANLDDPVFAFMTAAPVTLPVDSAAHRAKVALTRGRLNHLVLVEADGQIFNLLSPADLPGFREGGAETLIQSIELANNVDSMAKATIAVRQRGSELFSNGMGVEALCQWMSGLNDLISMRVIELVADEFDLPPVSWCWMAFGSEGRLEQTFATDQDNGLIFQPENESDTPRIRAALLAFAKAVNKALDHCGFALCRGGIMAGNPSWCLSVEEWQQRYLGWMSTPDPKALLYATIFFDFRPLYGQDELVDDLHQWLLPQPAEHPRFLYAMADEALTCVPSLGWLGGFSYDGGNRYPHTIDLKKRGSRPFVDSARIWTLKHGIWSTNTTERLRRAGEAMERATTDTIASIEAFDVIQRLRIQRQLAGGDYDEVNRIDPKQLSITQRQMLKEAFRQAKSLQLRLRQEFLG
ncbi:MAG: DUF294 nucleotidyltransferase-like domain-containing protein [Candidatus Thiodiazotropha lotti]|uniref:DUF294 nucleotidyltransferase-like domain-containing protein n=1 Tax=Candidatus Thiodiazotropha lotti TaxID=2792787 RepID=A0A9E4K2C2_9GAMM|nr:DUF294 nucleotidyltransferase-like domain-containing protein [Candidatus Thiodiazotropha lotti]MCW4202544.1 DUF294 nucleotidyltransferase-like domain-containing protein [Candidatus Thiodiazotropha lotti]